MSPKDPTQSPYPPPAAPARQTLPDLDKTRTILSMKLEKKTLDLAVKHFQFLMSPEFQVHFPPGPLIWKRSQKTLQKKFFCQAGNLSEIEIILQWLITAVTPEDIFVFSLNGTPLDVERKHFYKGRDARLHPEKLPPYSVFCTRLPNHLLLNGDNLFEAKFAKLEPSLNTPVELRELELKIFRKKKGVLHSLFTN